jgi:KaiC/GvpD/RAD55 family RecA-like ATPase
MKDMTAELRNSLYGRSSVFVGSMDTPTERIVYHILYETVRTGKTVIWVCLRDTPNSIFSKFSSYELPMKGFEENIWFVDSTIIGDSTITAQTYRCQSLDYACMIMEVVKLLKKYPASLVMFDNIGILAALDRVDVIVRPLKYLDTRIRAQGGGFVTLLANKAIPGSVEDELLGLIDVIIRVDEEKIHTRMGSKELSIPFCFTGSELILGSVDADKELQDLFNLTPDEKKKLELEVDEKALLYGEPTY